MMKVATDSVQAAETGLSLEQVKQRFALWRESRQHGGRIPSALWGAAVEMAALHGMQRIAQELHVDYDRLKKRLGQDPNLARAGKVQTQFVEMFSAPVPCATPINECIVEMENARGGKMRVELKSLVGLAGLANAFWSAR
jgi:hypothetical protein